MEGSVEERKWDVSPVTVVIVATAAIQLFYKHQLLIPLGLFLLAGCIEAWTRLQESARIRAVVHGAFILAIALVVAGFVME